nr:nucleotidyltransferase [Lysobacter sp.]
MDVVPGIRADDERRRELGALMEARGVDAGLARELARRALWITDKTHRNYPTLSPEWPSSNPGGYQLWFASRMTATSGLRVLAEAQVDPAPIYRSKTPLQQCVQLFKRHRDIMFTDNCDAKPASIILTTVAGLAYRHGESLADTMSRTLDALEQVRASDTNEILNPVNSKENFADRWARPDCAHLLLKHNFHKWIAQARRDFGEVLQDAKPQRIVEVASDALGVTLSEAVRQRLGVPSPAPSIRRVAIAADPPRPWLENR